MLKRANRVVRPADFRATVRSGRRITTPSAVLYIRPQAEVGPTRVGLIVSKAVGNSVVRSRVSRRLRSIGLDIVRSRPTGKDLVIRALPGSPSVSWSTLQGEIVSGLERSGAL